MLADVVVKKFTLAISSPDEFLVPRTIRDWNAVPMDPPLFNTVVA